MAFLSNSTGLAKCIWAGKEETVTIIARMK